MKDVSFGQYYPVDSVVHRLDPRLKLILTILYITTIFFIKTFAIYGVMFLFLLTVILISRVPPLSVLRSIKAVIFLVLFTAVLNLFFYRSTGSETPLWAWKAIKIYKNGLLTAGKMALRIILLVLGSSFLTLTTTPVALTDAIEKLLWPIPAHTLAMIMSIALRLIPTLIEETDKVVRAQKARGADFESGNLIKKAKALLPVLIPLFVNSFRRADELALAMDSRCYNGAKGRTRMKKLKYHWRDLAAFLIMAALFVFVLFIRYNWLGWAWVGFLY